MHFAHDNVSSMPLRQTARQGSGMIGSMRQYPAIEVTLLAASTDAVDLIAAAIDDSNALALEELETESKLRAFFGSTSDRDEALAAVRTRFPQLEVAAIDIPDDNWAERSQAALTAIRVGALTIAPPWDRPDDAARTIVIVPSMGFGTGHHATTRLCLTALQHTDPRGKNVVDAGTGSGVLALAAARLGASRVVGIDSDPDAIANAIENRAQNDVAVEFVQQDLASFQLHGFDIVLANLTGAALERFARRLTELAIPGGVLILSGLRVEEETQVRHAFESLGAGVELRAEEEGWVCLEARRGP